MDLTLSEVILQGCRQGDKLQDWAHQKLPHYHINSVFFSGLAYPMEALLHRALHQENVIYLYFSRFAISTSCDSLLQVPVQITFQ